MPMVNILQQSALRANLQNVHYADNYKVQNFLM